MAIELVQYVRPNARKTRVTIDRSPEIEKMAHEIQEDSAVEISVEAYNVDTKKGPISMVTLLVEKGETVYAIENVENGPEVPEAIDRLIRRAYEQLGLGRSLPPEKPSLADQLKELTGSTIFQVVFTKKNGEERTMNCRIGKKLENSKRAFDPNEKGLVTVFDVDKGGWRSIPMDRVKKLKIRGVEYLVGEE